MSDPMSPEVREWMQRTDAQPPDAQQAARQVMSRLPEVRQRRRWWPFPLFYRKPQPPATTDSSEYQPVPVPATDGHTPTIIGRTEPMFSPSKALIAGVLVLGIGGALLIAQPFQQQAGVPGAATEPIPPKWVTGRVSPASTCTGSDIVWEGDVGSRRNAECSPQMWTSSDPRLTGAVVRRWSDDIYRTDDGDIWVTMAAASLRNDEGGWACSASDLSKGIGTTADGTTVDTESVNGGTATFDCVGDGGYAGLSAILVLTMAGGFSEDFVGLIFSGDFPPLPAPPVTE